MDVTPIPKTISRRRDKRPGRVRCSAHVAWVKTLPSLVSGDPTGSDAHHLMPDDPSAMSLKSGDDKVVPLAAMLHRPGFPGSLHTRGDERAWWAEHGIDGGWVARRLWAASVVAGRAPASRAERTAAAILASGVEAWIAEGYPTKPPRHHTR